MRFAHFFVDRPIFASVLSIVAIIVGLVAYRTLPVAEYPEIAPPTIVVRASYPGADAQTVQRAADAALYRAKGEGKNRVSTAPPEPRPMATPVQA